MKTFIEKKIFNSLLIRDNKKKLQKKFNLQEQQILKSFQIKKGKFVSNSVNYKA